MQPTQRRKRTKPVKIMCQPHIVAALRFAEDWHAPRYWEWWEPRRAAALAISDAAARRHALAELYDERDALVEAGELIDGLSPQVVPALEAELDRRIYRGQTWRARNWPEVPANAGRIPGRRWGSAGNPARDWTEPLQLRLPVELHEVLQRATYKVSASSVSKLQQLAVDYPGPTPPPAIRQRIGKLQAKVVTIGDVVRAAAAVTAAPWFPTVQAPPHER